MQMSLCMGYSLSKERERGREGGRVGGRERGREEGRATLVREERWMYKSTGREAH